jgi:hypothetical protein
VCADRLATGREVRPDIGVHSRDWFGDRYGLEAGEEVLDERAPPGPDCPCRAQDAVEQFADRDDADQSFLVAERVIHRRRFISALEVDQEIGVDQAGHGSPGGPTP